MKKIFIGVSVLLLLLYSCNNLKKKSADGNITGSISELMVDEFQEVAGTYVDQKVMIAGRVTHVCRHGGQRLFITGDTTDQTVRITTGENIPEFDIALEGSLISVTGIVKELIIDETYLAEWEMEVLEGTGKEESGHQDGLDEHQKQQAELEGGDPLANIQSLRDEIAASGKDHLSDYWIETIEFAVKEQSESR